MHKIFVNENLTPANNKIVFYCRELKRNSRIDKTCSRDGIVQIVSKNIENGKKIKVMHMNTLNDRFPDFCFGEDAQGDHNDSSQSSYQIYPGITLKWCCVIIFRSGPWDVLWKKGVLKVSFRVLGKYLWMGLLLVKLQATTLQPIWKRTFLWVIFNDFDSGIHLGTLGTLFSRTLFLQINSSGCFGIFLS